MGAVTMQEGERGGIGLGFAETSKDMEFLGCRRSRFWGAEEVVGE